MARNKAIAFTPNPKVYRHIEKLVSYGLFGRTRADVVNRLVCEGIERKSTFLPLRAKERARKAGA